MKLYNAFGTAGSKNPIAHYKIYKGSFDGPFAFSKEYCIHDYLYIANIVFRSEIVEELLK